MHECRLNPILNHENLLNNPNKAPAGQWVLQNILPRNSAAMKMAIKKLLPMINSIIEKGGLSFIVFNTTDSITKKMNHIIDLYVDIYYK